MMTTRLGSQTFAVLPNSRLNTPMVPGPQTSCVMSTSAFTQILSPACTEDLPAARARIFSVNVIRCESKRRTEGGQQMRIKLRTDFNYLRLMGEEGTAESSAAGAVMAEDG